MAMSGLACVAQGIKYAWVRRSTMMRIRKKIANVRWDRQRNRIAQRGFTLIELLVVIGILAVISSIAMPIYTDYVESSRRGALLASMATIEVFQEDFRLRTGSYAVDLVDLAAINAAIGWAPQDANGVAYAIADSDGTIYQLTATDAEGMVVCREYPSRDAC
jgi:prepilin-type N-terminal cleavage/methylation domain-containing protein